MKSKCNMFCVLVICLIITNHTRAQLPVYLDNNQPIELRIQDALSRMTLEEKVNLCAAQSNFSSPGVPRLGIPELVMTDGPHGIRQELLWDSWSRARWTTDSCTGFPALTCLASTWNTELSYAYGKALGEEARYRRKDVLLAPGVNMYRTPLNGSNFEYMGEDPFLASKLVVPFVEAVQSNGVAACVKHFALNEQEKWRNHINVEVSNRALHEIYLPPFKAAVVDAKAWAIMGAYNKFRGKHACHSEILLKDILKGEWKFDGCVISDWAAVHDTKEAALDGLDIEMGTWENTTLKNKPFTFNDYYLADPYLNMLRTGEIPLSNVDEKATRILRLIFRTAMNTHKPFGSFANEDHHNVARKVAEEGIVLLKNSAGLLPIDASKYKNIAVIGENATRKLTIGGGSSELKVKYEISPLQGIIEKFGSNNVTYTMGYASGEPRVDKVLETTLNLDSLRKSAVALAAKSDLVIYVGGLNKNYLQDCEGADRQSFALPFGQNELIADIQKVNKNVVLVMLSGNAYEMPWINQATTLVQAWYLGSEAGRSIANVLSGDVNPSGKLPFTFPVKLTDVGAHAFDTSVYPGDSINVYYKEDIFVGYRWFDKKKIAPLYPFGFGLSYTNFEYGKAVIENNKLNTEGTISISIPVKNCGKIRGKEVVQLYITDQKSSEIRPEKELKAFEKIELNPGEQRNVKFTIDKTALQFYSDVKKGWVTEPGKFTAQIGASSRDIKTKVNFEYR